MALHPFLERQEGFNEIARKLRRMMKEDGIVSLSQIDGLRPGGLKTLIKDTMQENGNFYTSVEDIEQMYFNILEKDHAEKIEKGEFADAVLNEEKLVENYIRSLAGETDPEKRRFSQTGFKAYLEKCVDSDVFMTRGDEIVADCISKFINNDVEKFKKDDPEGFKDWLVTTLKHEKNEPVWLPSYDDALEALMGCHELSIEVELDEKKQPRKVKFMTVPINGQENVEYRLPLERFEDHTMGQIREEDYSKALQAKDEVDKKQRSDMTVMESVNDAVNPLADESKKDPGETTPQKQDAVKQMNKDNRTQIDEVLGMLSYRELAQKQGNIHRIVISGDKEKLALRKVVRMLRDKQGIQAEAEAETAQQQGQTQTISQEHERKYGN